MIDGKRGLAALPPLCDRAETLAIADLLLAEGMVAIAASLLAEKDAVATQEAMALGQSEIEKIRLFMVNTTDHFVGVFASGLVQRIEHSSTATELLALRKEWRRTIASSSKGVSQIDDLDAELARLFGS